MNQWSKACRASDWNSCANDARGGDWWCCRWKQRPFGSNMGVSKNGGTPRSSHLDRDFHYKPSILGYHYFWKHPNNRDSQKTVYTLQAYLALGNMKGEQKQKPEQLLQKSLSRTISWFWHTFFLVDFKVLLAVFWVKWYHQTQVHCKSTSWLVAVRIGFPSCSFVDSVLLSFWQAHVHLQSQDIS